MCGLFGYAGAGRPEGGLLTDIALLAARRGPDSWGIVSDLAFERGLGRLTRSSAHGIEAERFVIGHCRLVTCLGTKRLAACQPLIVGDYVVAHNGTVDNAEELCARHGFRLTTGNDSECIGHLLRRFGGRLDEVMALIDGPYAVAVLDMMRSEVVVAARGIPLTVDDVVILCFGEIDCRCHVHVQAALPGRSLDEVVQTLADRYLDRVVSLDVHGARVGVLSATPPTTAARTAGNPDFPVAGTDAQRAAYTRQLNLRLQVGCSRRGLLYVDTHSQYQDANGMLDVALADWNVHIKDTSRVEAVLRRMGLL
jgi:hypothetical protein